MKTKCPHCGEEYEVESDDLGRTAECSTCGGEFQVSDADASPEIKIAIPLSNDAFAESVREEASSSSESPSAGTKTCPFCFSAVPLEARKCASCGEWIPDEKSSGKKTEICPFCQTKLQPGAKKCAACGEWMPGCKPKNRTVYLVLLLFFGMAGFHDFYANRPNCGIGKLSLFLLANMFLLSSVQDDGGEEALFLSFIFVSMPNLIWCFIDFARCLSQPDNAG